MNIFIFGFGYTALRFADRSRAAFTSIAGTVRQPDKREAMRRLGYEAFVVDAPDQQPHLIDHLRAADVVLVSAPPGASGDPVLAAFAPVIAQGHARVIYLSTVGVYGDHEGAWIDEDTPPAPQLARARARIEAEQAWAEVAGNGLMILRLAGIYGPGRNALTRLRSGTARRIVKPGQVFNRIHVDDAGHAITAAIAHRNEGIARSIWNVCDDEPAPPQDVIAYAAGLLGVPVPPDEDFATAEQTPMARSFYATNNRIANARLKSDLGVRLAYPTYRVGLEALLKAGD
jgi:nucleoside-diphosphate-sugar epimerase